MNQYFSPQQFQNHVARYPVLGQLMILGSALLLIFSGIFFTRGKGDVATVNEFRSVQHATGDILPLPEPSSIRGSFTAPVTEAAAIVVYDVIKDEVIFARNETEALPLASITKLMTALLVTELMDQEETVVITPAALAQHGHSGFSAGETVSAANLNRYSLLSSSNDAAYALATSLGEAILPGEGSRPFIDAMNVRAQELQLTTTAFQNPTGLDVSSYESSAQGSAYDVTMLMRYLLEHQPELLVPTRARNARIYNELGQYLTAQNTNPLAPSIPNLLGSKTGYTELAGGNLTIAFDAGFNRPVIITVLGSTFQGRFQDVASLIQATQTALRSE